MTVLLSHADTLRDCGALHLEVESKDTSLASIDYGSEMSTKSWPVHKTKYATFPHRKCVGWMAYVRKPLSQDNLPSAAAVLPAPGGAIVISVNEAFDLANQDHIQRANEVEMDMNDLGLLGITDPTF